MTEEEKEFAPILKEFIGKAKFDEFKRNYIWGVRPDRRMQMVAEIIGQGSIQNIPKLKGKEALFQDFMGRFIADAINEKLEKL